MQHRKDKKLDPSILVLTDERIGASYQSLALAEQIKTSFGINYSKMHMEYNSMVHMPNLVLSKYPFHVKKLDSTVIQNMPQTDIIISAGRRAASVAVYLKNIHNKKTKIIQILKPDLSPEHFELIILPQHDKILTPSPNICRVIGALSDINSRLTKSRDYLDANYPEMKNFIAVIVGGDTKNYSFTQENATEFFGTISKISDNHSLPLFVTFSRRTPVFFKNLVKKNLSWPNLVYDPEDGSANPYPGIISYAHFIICTSDSISMCSEAAATGNPIYLYMPSNFHSSKHKYFIQQLVDLGVAKILDVTSNFLEKYSYKPLNETQKVADIVGQNILGQKVTHNS